MDMSDVIKYPLSAAIELCEQLDNDETNYHLKMLEYKRERDEAREAFVIATDQMVIAQGKVREANKERDEAREEVKQLKVILDLIKKDTI